MKKFWQKHHKGIIIAVIAAAVFLKLASGSSSSSAGYSTAIVTRRDITTYNSFIGTVEPVTERSVVPKVSGTVSQVLVKNGDSVVKGQTIAILDSSDAEYSLEVAEATAAQTEKANNQSVQDAITAYNNYQSDLNNGLNSSLQAAQAQKDATYGPYKDAESAYNSAVSAREKAISSASAQKDAAQAAYDAFMNDPANQTAITNYNNAAAQLAVLQSSLDQADLNLANANTALQSADEASKPAAQAAYDTAAQVQSEAKTAFDQYKNVSYDPANTAYQLIFKQMTVLQTALDSANAAYSAAQSTAAVDAAKDAYDKAYSAWDQARIGYDSVASSVQQQLGNLESSVQRAATAADSTVSDLQIEHQKESLSDYTLTAPMDGTVTELAVKEGDACVTGTPAAVISNLSHMEVSIRVDEYSVLNVSEGSAVTIYIDSIGKSYPGTISSIDEKATVQSGVSYFGATVEFTADSDVRSGMSTEVRLTNADEKQVLSLPADAVSYHSDNTAYVLDENGQEKAVTIGVSDGDYVEITDGLSEGDIVRYIPSVSDPMSDMTVSSGDSSDE